MKQNIDLDTYILIARAGILMGQKNPNQNPDKLLKMMVDLQMQACIAENSK